MRRFSTRRWLLFAALAAAGCGRDQNGDAPRDDPRPGLQVPLGTNEQAEDVRLLATVLMAQHVCSRVRGQLLPVGGEGEAPAEGRMWIRDCTARMEEEQIVLTVNAAIWSWVGERSSAVGADFEVSQHVGMEAEVELRVVPHVRYDREEEHAFVWLEPVEDPAVSVRTVGHVDAEAQGLWAEAVAFAAGVFGSSEDERAAEAVQEQASVQLEQRVDEGVSFAMDLCTSQTATELGRVTEMPAAEVPDRGAPGERVARRLRPRGFDAAGPFRSGEVTVEVTDGSPVDARLVCADDAKRLIRAFLDRGLDAMPEVDPLARARLEQGRAITLRSEEPADCDAVLVTQLAGRGASTFAYVEVPAEPVALVAGCAPERRQARTASRSEPSERTRRAER